MYPRSVPIPIDEASIFLFSRKIPVMVWCIIPGFNEGRVLLNYRIFQTFWVTPPKHVNPIWVDMLENIEREKSRKHTRLGSRSEPGML